MDRLNPVTRVLTDNLWAAFGGSSASLERIRVTGAGSWPSPFPVSDLAVAVVAAAGCALAELTELVDPSAESANVVVDRAVASSWFGFTLRPSGWQLPAAWDPIAGNYRCDDGWIRLHTNVAAHRRAVLRVLGLPEEPVAGARDAVAAACRGHGAEQLEEAIVAEGGCAGAMRSLARWREHPQGRAVASTPLVEVAALPDGGSAPTGWASRPGRPLAGLRVLDLTRVLAGPVATRVLAGLGATVLRIDPPWWSEPGLVPEVTVGKRCARLDVSDPVDRERLAVLLADADVVVHTLRPGALERLGLGRTERARLRPGLIDVAMSAYGTTGPWSGRRGFDSVVQMTAGLSDEGARRTGGTEPLSLPVQALDHAAGWLLATAALRGLAGSCRGEGGTVTATSLAAVAHLLASAPRPESAAELDPASVGNADGVEYTDWGPARRMPSPLLLGAVPALRFARGAVDLGHDAAAWPRA